MKLTAFLILATLIQASAAGYSQTITLNQKNAPLEKIFQLIEKQTNHVFFYNEQDLKKANVSVNLNNASLAEALESCFRTLNLSYKIIDKNILVKRKDVFTFEPPAFLSAAIPIRGRVVDEKGLPLPAATIKVKGSNQSTVSQEDGTFSINIVEENATLVVSFLGFVTREIPVRPGTTFYDVALQFDNATMSEVIVVGYGTQEKTKVTGSVSQVGEEVFTNRPITSIGQGLQGAIPNLNISFGDGQLNRGATFNLRGFTSITGGMPLILVDGTPGDINLINPEDVETVTVLKDAASSAIYGARAAFGVILITTKSAKKEQTNIRYTNNFGISNPIRVPDVVNDPLENAMIQNEAYRGYIGTDGPGMLLIIDYLKRRQADPSLPELGVDAAGNYIRGASTDWYGEFYNDNAPFSKNYLSLSGSKGNTGYFMSLGRETQEGIYKTATDKFTRNSVRLKLDTRLADWAKVFNNVEFSTGIYDTPNKFVSDGGYNVYRYLSLYANPYEAIKTPNGNYTQAGMTTFGQLENGGRTLNRNQMLKNTLGLQTNFFNDRLTINGDYTYLLNQTRGDVQYLRLQYEARPNTMVNFTNPDYYSNSSGDNSHHIINLYSSYQQRFNNHNFKGLIGFNQEFNQLNTFTARRNDNITRSLGSINLTNGDATLTGRKSEWALQGFFARMNYDFKNRYLLEVNGRYDGTSRFEKSKRFGFFPSVSAGWVVSNENFMKPISETINTFKVRASYGSLGNQLVSDYAYIRSMTPYIGGDLLDVNGQLPLAIRAPGLTPFSLTWETANTFNVGFDVEVLKNRLQLGFDYFNRETKDMLTKGQTMPAVLGTAEPRENAADLMTKGWEMSLKWGDKVNVFKKPLSYNLSFVLSDNRTFITKFDNPSRLLTDYYVGMEVGEIWGYKTLGFFKTDTESASHADQSKLHLYPGLPKAGDIKFEDTNGDGVISLGKNTVDDPGDRRIIGNTTPRYAYGANMGLNWSNFSLDVFVQGVGKRDFWPGTESAVFWGFYNRWNQPVYSHIKGNYWTPENPDAYFPRLRAYEALTDTRSLGAVQTRYLQNASYLRLKNVTLGYTLPKSLVSKVKLSNARIFFAGQNLHEWTKLSIAYDPEGLNNEVDPSNQNNGAGFVYPMQRTYTFGVEINL